MPTPAPDSKNKHSYALFLAVAAGFLITFLLGIWKNDFPFYYHVDEPSKARQILTGERNLHHPLLMLSSADLLVQMGMVTRDAQSVTEAGRTVSAFFSAAAVALLTLTIGAGFGVVAGWITALLASTHWNIFELAHYFKEDPSLAFGLMCTFAAIALWRRKPGGWSAMVMGAALALALSGKYIGVIVLPYVIIVWFFYRPVKPWQSLALLLATLAVVFVVINLTMFIQPDTLRASLKKETLGVLHGGEIATKGFFHGGFFKRILQVSKVALFPGLLFLFIFGWKKIKQWPIEVTALISFPFFLALVLGFSQKDSGRYFLPGVFGLCAASAVGWKLWIDYMATAVKNRRSLQTTTVVLALVAIVGSGVRLYDYAEGFGQGTRERVSDWIANNLPPTVFVAQSMETKLADPAAEGRESVEKAFPQKLITIDRLSNKATLESLKAQGVTHLVATESEWKDYLRSKKGKVREGKKDVFAQRQDFWRSVVEQAEEVWSCEAGKVGTHNPPIKVWQIQ